MTDDPTIARIRAVRHQISEQYQHNVQRIINHYIAREQQADALLCRPQRHAMGEITILIPILQQGGVFEAGRQLQTEADLIARRQIETRKR